VKWASVDRRAPVHQSPPLSGEITLSAR